MKSDIDFENNAIRTVTYRLIPALVILYVVACIDRGAIGFAHLHMKTGVGIGDAAYEFGAGLYFLSVVSLFDLVLTYFTYSKLEKCKSKQLDFSKQV